MLVNAGQTLTFIPLSNPGRQCEQDQRWIRLPAISYLSFAAVTESKADSTSWTICCLNPVSNFRRYFPIDQLLPAILSHSLVEPIAASPNSQLFSPVNGAQSSC